MQPVRPINVLLAEDDEDHYFLIRKTWAEMLRQIELRRVADGEDLMECLLGKGRYAEPCMPAPDLIILDINMPRKDGWEALSEIKAIPSLRHIPIVVMTTSDNDEDRFRSYEMGACSYIRKPVELRDWAFTFHVIKQYWFDVVDLPGIPPVRN